MISGMRNSEDGAGGTRKKSKIKKSSHYKIEKMEREEKEGAITQPKKQKLTEVHPHASVPVRHGREVRHLALEQHLVADGVPDGAVGRARRHELPEVARGWVPALATRVVISGAGMDVGAGGDGSCCKSLDREQLILGGRGGGPVGVVVDRQEPALGFVVASVIRGAGFLR